MLLVYIVYLCSLHIWCYAASSVKLISLKYPNLWLIGMNLKWHGSHQSIFFLRTAPTTTASFGSSIIPAEPPTQSFCLGTNLQNHHESSESLIEFAYLALPFTFCFSLPVCVCCWFSLSAVHFIKSHKNTTHVWHFSEPAISDSKQPCEWKRLYNVASLLMSSSLNETNTVRPHNNQVQSQAFTKPQHKKGDIR